MSFDLGVSRPGEPSRWRFREVLRELDGSDVLEEDSALVLVDKVGRHHSPDLFATADPPRRVVLQSARDRVHDDALGPRGGQEEATVVAEVVGIRNEGRAAVQRPAKRNPAAANATALSPPRCPKPPSVVELLQRVPPLQSWGAGLWGKAVAAEELPPDGLEDCGGCRSRRSGITRRRSKQKGRLISARRQRRRDQLDQ